MKRMFGWQAAVGLILIMLTVFFYAVHFLVFGDLRHIFIYFIGDVAFVFFEVFLVALVIHQLLHHREKKALREKLNMLTGAFFSEVGTKVLSEFSAFDDEDAGMVRKLAVPEDWSEREFLDIRQRFEKRGRAVDGKKIDLEAARDLLRGKKQFLLDLLQNPNLIEDEPFTNLVWAMFHLTEELTHRHDLKGLPDADYRRLAEDIKRVYRILATQWMDYMKHLKAHYPYLFSLAARTNPFDGRAAADVK